MIQAGPAPCPWLSSSEILGSCESQAACLMQARREADAASLHYQLSPRINTTLQKQQGFLLTYLLPHISHERQDTEGLWAAGLGRAGKESPRHRQAEGRAEKEEAVFWEPPGNPCSCAQHHPLIMLTTNICLQLYTS